MKKEELLKKIAAATTAAEIINLISDVESLRDDEVTTVFCDRVKLVAADTDDLEGLKLLKKNLVYNNLYCTDDNQDDEMKKVILLKLIAAASDNDEILDLEEVVNDLRDKEIIQAYEDKKTSLI